MSLPFAMLIFRSHKASTSSYFPDFNYTGGQVQQVHATETHLLQSKHLQMLLRLQTRVKRSVT